jgi:hypothetical protein
MSIFVDAEARPVEVATPRPRRGRKPKAQPTTAVAIQSEPVPLPAKTGPNAEAVALFGMIERLMTDPNASAERAMQAFEFYQKVQAAQARRAFDAAMAAAKAEMPPIVKNQSASFGEGKGYKYEDMATIARVVDPVLTKHGLSYRYRTATADGSVTVTCVVTHTEGHSEENSLTAGRDKSGSKNDIQALGSAVTYLQRYTLKAALGLASSRDDDGHATSQPGDDAVIDDRQIATLRSLILETQTDINKFLAVASAPSLSDVRRTDFPRLTAMLNAKRARSSEAVQ